MIYALTFTLLYQISHLDLCSYNCKFHMKIQLHSYALILLSLTHWQFPLNVLMPMKMKGNPSPNRILRFILIFENSWYFDMFMEFL